MFILIESSDVDTDDEEDAPKAETSTKSTDKSVPWPLKLDGEGWPILPNTEGITLSKLKELVRSFLTLCYRMFHHSFYHLSLKCNLFYRKEGQ